MKTTEEMNAKTEMEALNKNFNTITEADLLQVAGGGKEISGLGIQWDDPRCERCATRAEIFGGQFQECNMYNQAAKDEVKALCEEFCLYIHTPEYFDLFRAMQIFLDLSTKCHVYSMTVTANAGWNIFLGAFNAIVQ